MKEEVLWKALQHHGHYLKRRGGITDQSHSFETFFLECYRMQLWYKGSKRQLSTHLLDLTRTNVHLTVLTPSQA